MKLSMLEYGIYISSACGELFAVAMEAAHETENSASENRDNGQENC